MWALTSFAPTDQPLQWGVVIGASLVAAWTDLAARRIPNLLTIPVFVAGLAWSAGDKGLAGLGDSLGGAAVMMLPMVLLFLLAEGGAGDAKLMAALGAWLGVHDSLPALAAVSASGVMLAVGYSLARRRLTEVIRNIAGIVRHWTLACLTPLGCPMPSAQAAPGMQTMPYGVAIFVGLLLAAMLWR